MERAEGYPVPAIDRPDSKIDDGVAVSTEAMPVIAAAGSLQNSREASNRDSASGVIADSAQDRTARGPCPMRHISFELALATGLSPTPLTDVLQTALDLALGRRR